MTVIQADHVYVSDVEAAYGASIQVISCTSGDIFTLGPVPPDGTACYAIKPIGFPSGETFTVTLQADQGGAKADHTVITYNSGLRTSAAAEYSGSGSLRDPTFNYTTTASPAPKETPLPPPQGQPIKANAVYVDASQAPYNGYLQVIDGTSGDPYYLDSFASGDQKWYPLEKLKLIPGQTFSVTLVTNGGGAMADRTAITYDSGTSEAAGYLATGSLQQPCFQYTGTVSTPAPPPGPTISVGSILVKVDKQGCSGSIKVRDTSSGKERDLGEVTYGGNNTFYPHKGSGGTCTLTLYPDGGSPIADNTIVGGGASYLYAVYEWDPPSFKFKQVNHFTG